MALSSKRPMVLYSQGKVLQVLTMFSVHYIFIVFRVIGPRFPEFPEPLLSRSTTLFLWFPRVYILGSGCSQCPMISGPWCSHYLTLPSHYALQVSKDVLRILRFQTDFMFLGSRCFIFCSPNSLVPRVLYFQALMSTPGL